MRVMSAVAGNADEPTLLRREVAAGAYLPGVDGLRAIAVLLVMVYHLNAAWLPAGFVGVDVFFVISGFVVTSALCRQQGLGLSTFIAEFYARRFRRILPALIVCLVVTALFSVAFIPEAWLSSALLVTLQAAFFGVSNVFLNGGDDGYFAPRAEFNPYMHTWSLGVEEQFYLVFPWLLYLLMSARAEGSPRKGRVALGVLVVLVVASLGWCAWTTRQVPAHAYYMLFSRFWELGAGALLALATAHSRPLRGWPAKRGLLLPAGLGLLLVSAVMGDAGAFPFPWALPSVMGTVLAILGVQAARQGSDPLGLARGLGSRLLVGVGLLSYSLYLWHWPTYTLFRWTFGLDDTPGRLTAVAVTVVLAWLSYRFIEVPVQRSSTIRRLRVSAAITAGLVLVTLGCLLAGWLYKRTLLLRQSTVSLHANAWYPTGCRGEHDVSRCPVQVRGAELGSSIGVPTRQLDAGRRIYLIGDSHAGAYRRLMNDLIADTGLSYQMFSRGGCAVAALVSVASESKGCQDWRAAVESAVVAKAGPGDVVFLASLRLPRLIDQDGRLADGAKVVVKPADVAEADRLVARLLATGARVIVDAPKPVFRALPFRCVDWFNRRNAVCQAGLAVERSFIDGYRAPVVDALHALATRHPGLIVWDPLLGLCSAQRCVAADPQAPDQPLFFDADHLSGYGNERLLPSFKALL